MEKGLLLTPDIFFNKNFILLKCLLKKMYQESEANLFPQNLSQLLTKRFPFLNIDNANLSVISSVQRHPVLPEMLEEIW